MSANPHAISSKSPAQQPFFCADCDRELKPGEGVTKKDRRVICAACEKKLQDRAEAGRQRSMFVEQESLFNPEGYRDESGQFHPIRASKDYNEFLAGDFEPRKLTAKQQREQAEWERQETEKLKAELGHKRSLAQFVRAQGGIVPGGMFAGEIRRLSYKDTGTTGLINQKARQGSHKQTAEYVMDAANAEGYRDRHGEPFTSISDFLLAVEDSAVKGIDRFRAKGPTAKQRREKRLAKAMRENPEISDRELLSELRFLRSLPREGQTARVKRRIREGQTARVKRRIRNIEKALAIKNPAWLDRFRELRAEEKRAIAGAKLKGSLEAVENQIKEVSLDSWYRKPENKHLQKLALDRLKFRKAEVLAKMKKNPSEKLVYGWVKTPAGIFGVREWFAASATNAEIDKRIRALVKKAYPGWKFDGWRVEEQREKKNPRKKTVSQKISQLSREGYPHKQAIAIALSERRAGKVNPAGDVHIDAGHVTIVKGKSTVNPSLQDVENQITLRKLRDRLRQGNALLRDLKKIYGNRPEYWADVVDSIKEIKEHIKALQKQNPAKTVSQARAKVAQKADYLYRRADALEKAGKPLQARATAKRAKALLDAVWRSGKHSEGPVGKLPNPMSKATLRAVIQEQKDYFYRTTPGTRTESLAAKHLRSAYELAGFSKDRAISAVQREIKKKRGLEGKTNPYDPFYGEPEPRKRRARKPKAAKRNPSIKDIAEKFQGKTNGNVAEFKASSSAPANLARIGRLVFLKVAGRQIRVPGAMVAADGRERLWIVGNRTPLFNSKAKPGTAKDYGPVDAICYLTAKAHIGEGKRYEYVHEFGEEGGRKPHLLIDSEGMPILRGGDYKIKAEGIVN